MAEIVDRLQDHQPCKRIDPGHSVGILPAARQDARDKRAVAVIIPRPVVVIDKIPADDVIGISVLVVVDAIAFDFFGVFPDILPIDVLVVPIAGAPIDPDISAPTSPG